MSPEIIPGRSIALYGDSGSGKTSQIGEMAKWFYRRSQGTTLLATCDRGGYAPIRHLVKSGILRVESFDPTGDIWNWISDVCNGSSLDSGDVFLAIDSGTSIGEFILDNITKQDRQIGQQRTQKFHISKGVNVGINNESHYGLVQSFLRDAIWKSTWLTQKGVTVLWTFATLRGEKADDTPILGPMAAGKALTPNLPRWFEWTFRLVSKPGTAGEPPSHVLYLQEQPDFGGTGMSFGNPRYPMDAITPLPATIEPASLSMALELIEQGEREAEDVVNEKSVYNT